MKYRSIRQLIWTGAVAVALTGSSCEKTSSETNNTEVPPTEEVQRGIRYDDMDTSVSPRENFYLFTNGGYINRTVIPEEESRWGRFSELRDEADARVRSILEDASSNAKAEKGSMEQKIGDFYRTGMDEEAINKAGLAPIQDVLDRINNISSPEDVMSTIGFLHEHGVYAGFVMYVDLDSKNSERQIVNLSQGGTGLPDRDYYLKDGEEKENIRAKYLEFLTELHTLAGASPEEAMAKAETVMAFETALAKSSLSVVDRRDPYKTYHIMNLEGLSEAAPNLPWDAFFGEIGLADPGEFNVGMPDFMAELSKQAKEKDLDVWKTYLTTALLRNAADYMGEDWVNAGFNFYGKVLQGTPELRPRWKRVTEHTNYSMGMGIGELYVKRHFSANAKKMALEMVDNILAEMKDRLGKLEWLSPETREQAVHKLNTILPKIGYPDDWRDYSKMDISGDVGYVKNVMAARKFNFHFNLDKVGQPVDKTEWGMPPQIVNAYYNPSINEIVFPAGILQAPFFDEHVEPALNYAGFGAVIGHELIHAFDDQGSQFDAEGNLRNWWTDSDRENFEGRAEVVKNQYDNYTVLDTLHVNGQLTLGENIADIDGLRISYYAWKHSLDGKELEEKDGYTAEQRFFINYGQLWSSLMREEALRLMVATNPHSPPSWRVNGSTSSLPEFYEAFGVKEGDRMYRPEDVRMSIW